MTTARPGVARRTADLLVGLCYAFGSAADLHEMGAAARRVREAVGDPVAIRVALQEGEGRLRVAPTGGNPGDVPGRSDRREGKAA